MRKKGQAAKPSARKEPWRQAGAAEQGVAHRHVNWSRGQLMEAPDTR
jgi:hypothetical protein